MLRHGQDVADTLEQCAEEESLDVAANKLLCEQLRRATDALNQVTTPFAGRRMDARVRQALSGQRIEQMAV